MSDMIVINDLHKYFGHIEAVKGVDLTVKKGEVVAIVGPSGAGKSTMVQLLLRFWDPQSGAVRLGGTDIRRLPLDELRRQYGTVVQNLRLIKRPGRNRWSPSRDRWREAALCAAGVLLVGLAACTDTATSSDEPEEEVEAVDLPVIKALRVGVHCASVLKFVKRMPSAASLSR